MDRPDRPHDRTLLRYQIISAYLAFRPKRGERGALLAKLAGQTWTDPSGETLEVSAETIRAWVRRYRNGGLKALTDRPRKQRGRRLAPELAELICDLKREVPERSLDRIIHILVEMKQCAMGELHRSTVHRVLKAHGLSARACRVPDAKDLDRFEAEFPNDLWQSDLLYGPYLPDPQRPGKMRRANLYTFLDDHSRKLLDGRFSFSDGQPTLELALRRSLQRFGVPLRVYYDNGQVYHAHHMQQITATLGIHRVYTKVKRPEGHGKIEALNRYLTSAFIAEVKASPNIRTLDELNEAFQAWLEHEYNQRIHGETGQTPNERWQAGAQRVQYADEHALNEAFVWKEQRTPDKSGVFSLFGVRYQVGPTLARRRIEVRYDPEQLDEVEVHYEGKFVERVRPLVVHEHRRPKPKTEDAVPAPANPRPTADWLGHLVTKRRAQHRPAPTPPVTPPQDDAILGLLAEHLDAAVIDEAGVRTFLHRYGPFDIDAVRHHLVRLTTPPRGRRDDHLRVYLEALRKHCRSKP